MNELTEGTGGSVDAARERTSVHIHARRGRQAVRARQRRVPLSVRATMPLVAKVCLLAKVGKGGPWHRLGTGL